MGSFEGTGRNTEYDQSNTVLNSMRFEGTSGNTLQVKSSPAIGLHALNICIIAHLHKEICIRIYVRTCIGYHII